MPTVNTLVVDRADLLGLGQLHQLRGRVGRAGQRAYAYLFHPVDRVLSEQAYERLRTIGDHTELGSGFKIALRDLQIRGAGNLLGRDQSGHIAAIGYDLYVQMVSEAVADLKGEPRPQPVELSLDLPDAAHLPATYVEAEDVRLEAYRRLAAVRTDEQIDDVRTEWEDRFGPLPGAGRRPARGGPAAGRVPAPRGHRPGGVAPRGRDGPEHRPGHGEAVPDHPAGLGRGPAAPAGPRGHLPGRSAPAAPGRAGARAGTPGTLPAWWTCSPSWCRPAWTTGAAVRGPAGADAAGSIAAVKRQLSAAVRGPRRGRHRGAGLGLRRDPTGGLGQRVDHLDGHAQHPAPDPPDHGGRRLPPAAGERPAGRRPRRGRRRPGDLLDDLRQRRAQQPGRRPARRAVRRVEGHHRLVGRPGHGQVGLRVATLDGEISPAVQQASQSGTISFCQDATRASITGKALLAALPASIRTPRSGTRPWTRSSWPAGPTCPSRRGRVLQRQPGPVHHGLRERDRHRHPGPRRPAAWPRSMPGPRSRPWPRPARSTARRRPTAGPSAATTPRPRWSRPCRCSRSRWASPSPRCRTRAPASGSSTR